MAADALDREGEDAVMQECIYSIMEKPKKLDDIGTLPPPSSLSALLPPLSSFLSLSFRAYSYV
jgi:hypothetical protein